MSTKNKFKNKIIWFFAFIIGLIALAIFVIPPMININYLKPKIENIILTQTGIPAKIGGDINFSLMGRTTIVAHDIIIPNGTVSSCKFTIPFFDIFNLKDANVSGDITIYGASLSIKEIIPFKTNNEITVHDSNIRFLNKEYHIINATLSKNTVNAIVRTDQHKYEITSHNNTFTVKNKNNDLNLFGELSPDGTANAHIEITAQNINRWFEFEKPRITGQFPITADVFWDGQYGIKFSDINANGITGSIDWQDDGYKIIKLKSDTANYDLSFLLKTPEILQNASFNLDFHGDLKFADNVFHHVKIITVGSNDEIKVDTIIADDLKIHGGTIDKDGGHNLHVSVPEFGVESTCLFNGTPSAWSCDNFSYGGIVTGKLYIDKKHFEANISSPQPFNDFNTVIKMAQKLGTNGYVKFDTPDMKGTLVLKDNKPSVSYTLLNNKSLNWANIDLPFIPEFMKSEPGDFIWTKDSMSFTPKSNQWRLSTTKDFFIIHGDDFKQWFPDINLQFLRDSSYIISGNYKNGNISNLTIEFAGHKFTGTATNKSITLKTDILNLDFIIDSYFKDNFEELSFFHTAPIMLPFELHTNLALSADKLVYNYKQYDNFVYSLHDDTQTFSISDSKHGNILSTIKKHNWKYALNIQLNKFAFDKKLLPENMPLNISDTLITAEIKLNTSGKIAHDIINNLHGTFDISFDGGKLYGFGFDNFYASAEKMTILNSDYLLSNALSFGTTKIKKMHITGTYESGDIKTLRPLTISMNHVDGTGILEIQNNEMMAKIHLILRGTAPSEEPIDIVIYPNDNRDFSLSEIMTHFDSEYMKRYVQDHINF